MTQDSEAGYASHMKLSPGRGREELMILHAEVMRQLTSRPYKVGAKHAEFSPD